jgi:hypothetical protein
MASTPGGLLPLPIELTEKSDDELRELPDREALLRFARLLRDRARAVLDHWEPLLEDCLERRTKLPLRDLVETADRIQSVAIGLHHLADEDSQLDVATLALERAMAALRRWIPEGAEATNMGRHLLQSRYRTGSFTTPGGAVPVDPRARLRRVVAALFALWAVVGAVIFFATRPAELALAKLEHYQEAVPEVLDRQLMVDLLVFRVDSSWVSKPRGEQAVDVNRLLARMGSEPINEVRIEGPDGRSVVRVLPNGLLQWSKRRVPPSEVRTPIR